MPGFYITNAAVPVDNLQSYGERIVNQIEINNFKIKQSTINKFINDKCFSVNENYVIIQEGVLLNKAHLFKEYKQDNIFELIVYMYNNYADNFFEKFRGSFSGALYDRKQCKWIIYTNQIGDNALFYCHINDVFIVSSQFSDILETLKKNNIKPTINNEAIRDMLTYAFMSKNHTYAKDVFRLKGGGLYSFSR